MNSYNYPPGTIRAEVMPAVRKYVRLISKGRSKKKIIVMAEDEKKAEKMIDEIRCACFPDYRNSGDVDEDFSQAYEKKYNNRRHRDS